MNKLPSGLLPFITLTALLALSACAGVDTARAPVEDRGRAQTPDTAESPTDTGEPVEATAIDPATASMERVPSENPAPADETRAPAGPVEPVVLAALDEAETLAARGDNSRAMASLERGIRIKPKDPWLWHQLSVLKLRSGQWLDAIAMAGKSNSLAGDNRQLLSGNWMVIAEAREARGELPEAEAARRKAEAYASNRDYTE